MNFSINLPPQWERSVVFGIPTLGLLAAVGIAIPRYQDLLRQNEQLAITRKEVFAKQTTLAQLRNMPLGPTVARMPATREEPVRFLHNLNALAAQCRVRIITYTASAAPTPNPASLTGSSGSPGASPSPGAVGEAGLPPGTTTAVLTISAEGSYGAIALFFSKLETYPRLLSVSNVTMNTESNNYPLLKTQFQLTRYLGADEPATPAPAGASAPQPGATPAPAPTPAR